MSYDQKPYRPRADGNLRRALRREPLQRTNCGRAILAKTPDPPRVAGHRDLGSRRGRGDHDDTKYALGSVLNHVLMHQTIIGQEAMLRLRWRVTTRTSSSAAPAAANFAGIAFPFIGQQLRGAGKTKQRRIVAVEPAACPSLTRGKYAYDFGDTAHMTPLTKMHTPARRSRRPASTRAGCATTAWRRWSHLKELGLIEAVATTRPECFQAGVLFRAAEGIVPAPEANHAVKGAIQERCAASARARAR